MATLQKLSVSGIRSFEPESREVITFYPLTIILGANGAGKTTLIECLRYSATNEFPPYTNKGKTWIHDLHFSKSHTIRGQVKLAFKDIQGEECVLTRSLELTAKRDRAGKTVPQMRTLDAIIKRGDQTVVSSKCVEVDSVMLDLLGVSKAVLSDVIFCHQEDSNWPLSESKVLKEKFDQLFGSIGYVKALKKIQDDRKEYDKVQTQYEGEVKLFTEHKEQYEKYMKELAKHEASLVSYKEKMNTLTQELAPIKKEMEDLAIKEKKIIDVEKVISNLTGQLEEQQSSIEYVRQSIKELFDGSKEELEEKILKFSEDLKVKEELAKKAESEITKLEDDLHQLDSRLNTISLSRGKLDARRAKNWDDKKKLKKILDNLVSDEFIDSSQVSNLDLDDQSETEAGLMKVLSSLESKQEELTNNLEQLIASHDRKIKEVESRLDGLKSKRSKLEGSIQFNTRAIDSKTSAAERVELQLKEIGRSASKFSLLARKIDEKKQELARIEEESNIEDITRQINRLDESIQETKSKLDELNREKDNLQKRERARGPLQVYMKNKENELDNLSAIYSRHSNILSDLSIYEQDYEKSFADELRIKTRQVERKVKTKETSHEALLTEKRKIESQIEIMKMKLESAKKDIKEKESKIKSICGSTPFESLLESTESKLKTLRRKSANSTGAQSLLTEYSTVIENDAKCPICDTDLADNRGKVIDGINEKIRKLPQEAQKVNQALAKKEELYGQLLALKAEHEAVKNLKESLPRLKQDVVDLQKKMDGINEKIQASERELKKEKLELDKLKSLEADAISYDNSARSLQDIENKIEKLKRDLGSTDAGDDLRSSEDVEEEMEELRNNLRGSENELKKLQTTKESHAGKLNSLKANILVLENERLELEKTQRNEATLREKSAELRKEIIKLSQDIEECEKEKENLGPILAKTEKEKERIQNEKEVERKKIESLLAKLKRYRDDFMTLYEDIQAYIMDGIEDELEEKQLDSEQCRKDKEELSKKKADLASIYQSYRDAISEAAVSERNLKDNLRLIKGLEKAAEFKAKLSAAMEQRGASDSVALLKKRQQLEKQYQEKSQQLQQIKGRQEPIVNSIQDLKKELETEKYKKAKENYYKKLIELVEAEAICDDLNKLYKALDHSVMIFHKKKMDEINRYLHRLWKQAYRGNDIDYIKIDSDTDSERLASDKRRSFNYRVVMIRDRVEMDMRGRCSAGQKVIASLVIRLALAEIFSANCGILALDEPTTNLDKENIQAFADSVSNIVKLHKNHRFQLVIITHDDQFLRCLRESDCEYYYHVSKDDKGYSRIKQLSIRERDD